MFRPTKSIASSDPVVTTISAKLFNLNLEEYAEISPPIIQDNKTGIIGYINSAINDTK